MHAARKLGGLGVPRLETLVPVWKATRRRKVVGFWGDDEGEALGELQIEVGGPSTTEGVKRMAANELYGRVDGLDLREAGMVRASTTWLGGAGLWSRIYSVRAPALGESSLPNENVAG